jgi:hypothetical protein
MACGDRGVDVVPVEGAVGGEGGHRPVDPVEQRTGPGAVVGILVRQRRRDDPAGAGIRGEVEFAPPAPRLRPMLPDEPLAGAAELQSRAVHQQVHGPEPAPRARHLQRLGPAAEGGVVGHGEVEAEQGEDGEAMRPSVWRSARRNTARSVSAVAIAKPE